MDERERPDRRSEAAVESPGGAPTIRQVALAAGVSITTVSQALTGHGRVAPVTRDRINRIAEELGYCANVHAQRLVSRRSRTFAIQVSGFADPSESMLPNSAYFLEVLNGASACATELGYALVITPPHVSADQLGGLAIDGAVIIDPHGDEPLFQQLIERKQPLVTTGRSTNAKQHPPAVDNDHYQATVTALNHLAKNGFTRPALILPVVRRSYTDDIRNGYHAWVSRHRFPCHIIEIHEPVVESEIAERLRTLLSAPDPPDTIYAGREDIAIAALHSAEQLGWAVPRDLGIASAVDSDVLLLTSPQITGTFLHPREIGEKAIHTLVELVEDRQPDAHLTPVPTTLKPRESTARRP